MVHNDAIMCPTTVPTFQQVFHIVGHVGVGALGHGLMFAGINPLIQTNAVAEQ